MLETIIIEPQHPAKYAVIWLHGLGADAHDFEPIVAELQLPATLGIRFIFPNAPLRPVSLYGGMPARAWFDLFPRGNDFGFIEAELVDMAQQVEHLIHGQIANGIAPHRIILVGFSQGGAMAIYTGLRSTELVGGMVGLSTLLPGADTLAAQAKHRPPVFLAHGTTDDIVPYARGVELSNALNQAAFPVTWHSYEGMAHSVCEKEINDIRQWLLQVATD
jgi:phospholipase/carboxylesterase